jgi:hypothetical protein
MQDTVSNYLDGVQSETTRRAVRIPMKAIADRLSCQATSTAGLVVTATTGHYVPKTGSAAFAGVVQGVPVAIAGGTDMPALVGTITATKYNIFCFFIDRASVVTSAMGIEGATLAAVKFPPFPEGKTLVGYIVVTYASTFTGGSTALDTATTVYVSPVGAFDPTVLAS